jgi:hypothetical protein
MRGVFITPNTTIENASLRNLKYLEDRKNKYIRDIFNSADYNIKQ